MPIAVGTVTAHVACTPAGQVRERLEVLAGEVWVDGQGRYNLVELSCRLIVQPIRSSAARTRRAFALGQRLTRYGSSR